MNIREAAQYFLESHKTFKRDEIAWGKDPLKQAIEYLENNGNSDPFLASADTYLEISGFESISGNPVIIEWYEYTGEMKQQLKEIEKTLEKQAPYFDDRLLTKERELKRLIAEEAAANE